MSFECATVRSLNSPLSAGVKSERMLRSWTFGAVVVTCAVIVLWIFRMLGPIDLRYDAGVYYVLGTSLAEGKGYRILSEPGAPTGIQYPPGLPAIVAAHQLLLGTSDPAVVAPWLRRTYAVMFLGLGLAVLALGRAIGGPLVGVAATLLCLFQANTFLLSDMLFTELPFTLLSVVFALMLIRNWLHSRPWLREGAGFLLAFAGFMLRSAGLALLFAWVMDAVFRRRWKLAGVRLVLSAVPFLLWQGHVMQVQRSEEYSNPAYEYQRAPYQYYNVSYAENLALVDPFQPERGELTPKAMIVRIASNLLTLPKTLGEVVSEHAGFWDAALNSGLGRKIPPGRHPPLGVQVPLWLLSGLTVLGAVILVRKRAWFVLALGVASIGLVLTTPWPSQFPRYLTPLGPFLTVAVVLGTLAVVRRFDRIAGWRGTLGLGAICGLIVMTALVQAFAIKSSFRERHYSAPVAQAGEGFFAAKWFYHDRTWTDWNDAVDWIGKNTPPDAVVVTDASHLCYLKSDRLSVMPPMEADPRRAGALMTQVPASYVIVDELSFIDISRRYALPAILANPEQWRRVFQQRKTSIYENLSVGTATQAPEIIHAR